MENSGEYMTDLDRTALVNYEELKIKNREKIAEYSQNPVTGNVTFFPAYLQVEQTNRCNAQCIMCNHFYLGNNGCADISEYVLDMITPILPYCETVMLNGDGEPFLSKNIELSIQRYHQYGVKIGTNTNLSYLPDHLLPYLRETFGFLNISCDGCTRETYEMIRAGLSFDIFLKNLSRLGKEAPGLIKCFDCVVMKQNIGELPGIVRLAHEYGIQKVKFQRLGVNPVIGNNSDRAELYYDHLSRQICAAKAEGEKLGIQVVCLGYEKDVNAADIDPSELSAEYLAAEISERKEDAVRKNGTRILEDDYYSERIEENDFNTGLWNAGKICQWAMERCYIDLKGNVTTCCFNMKKNFGSLFEKSFGEIWNGEEYIEFRKLMSSKMLPSFCRECNWIKESVF